MLEEVFSLKKSVCYVCCIYVQESCICGTWCNLLMWMAHKNKIVCFPAELNKKASLFRFFSNLFVGNKMWETCNHMFGILLLITTCLFLVTKDDWGWLVAQIALLDNVHAANGLNWNEKRCWKLLLKNLHCRLVPAWVILASGFLLKTTELTKLCSVQRDTCSCSLSTTINAVESAGAPCWMWWKAFFREYICLRNKLELGYFAESVSGGNPCTCSGCSVENWHGNLCM